MNSYGSFKPRYSYTFTAPYRRRLHPLAVEGGEGNEFTAEVDT